MRFKPRVALRQGFLIAALLAAFQISLEAKPNLIFLLAPDGEVAPDSLIRLGFAIFPLGSKAPDSCRIYHSAIALGDTLPGHTNPLTATASISSDSSNRILAFKPSDLTAAGVPQLGLGFHYLMVGCRDTKYVSSELPLWVSSRQSATILTPRGEETSASPNITWTPVPGVPAYHLLLSDQALNIDPEKGSVSGASVIWQAITTKASISYGTPDPSGNFSQVPAPPLSPNVPYNLVILNNYDGRSALATSAKAQGLKLFTIKSQAAALSKPKNIDPAGNKILSSASDSTLKFVWTASKSGSLSANTYKLYIYSLEVQDALEVLIPIFQTEVTDTFAVIDAKRTLLSKRYIWKVFALSQEGTGVVGDTTSFQYRNDVQTLSLDTRTLNLQGDTIALGDVRIDVVPLDGSTDALPLFSINTGSAEKVLAVGGYRLTFSKSGFVTESRTITLDLSGPIRIKQVLPPASCRITGHVVDAQGRDLDNVAVTSVGGGKTVSTLSDATGYFLLGVVAATHAVSFAKADYQSPPDTVLSLLAGKSLDLGKIVIARPVASLSGTVNNDKGAPLSGCQILIKSATGLLLRTLLSDDKGTFSAFLSPGTYLVTASRTGFLGEEKTVQLTDVANIGFQMTSGASVVKGRITLLSKPIVGSVQSAPLPGASVELVPLSIGAASKKTEADLRGEYTFSADTGSYTLQVARPGRALPDSLRVHIESVRSTLTRDVALQGLASIQGVLILVPDTVVNPASASITLLKSPGLGIFLTVIPQAAPVPGKAGNLAFTLEGIPDGKYQVTCGLPGYGLDVEPEVAIVDGVWKTDLALSLRKASKSLTFDIKTGGKSLPGSIHLLTPRTLDLPAKTKLGQASSGTYTLTAAPDSLAVIPLYHLTFKLASTGSPDTTITLAFPFSHLPKPLTFQDQKVELTLEASAPTDSVLLVYGYGTPTDTFHVPFSQLSGPPGPRTILFQPGAQGGLLTYYFIIHSGLLTYANDEPARRFRAQVEASHELATLRVTAGDTLRLPSHSRCAILLHAYDAAGRRLDSLVDAVGTIVWSTSAALSAKLGNRSHRTLALQTESPSTALAKRSSAIRWDTLRVTVTLDGVEKSLDLATKVVSTVINKLVVSTSQGEVAELPAPTSFSLFVTGFDTTTTPPSPMVPNPVLNLLPSQAGTIKELQAVLDPHFIGPLRILVKHINPDGSEATTELGAYRDSLQRGLNIGQTLQPGDSARLLFHDPLCELHIADSAFAGSKQAILRLYKRTVSKTFASGISATVTGSLYELSNASGVLFSKPPRLSLGIPTTVRSRQNQLRRFDAIQLDWTALKDSIQSETNSFKGPALAVDIPDLDGNYYGLLSASQGLTAGQVEIIPNPFSPLVLATHDGNTQYGTRIRLKPESDRSAEITISIKIYNMDSELIRHLVEHKTVPKAPIDFYWDGKADGGRWARNGRYLVKITVAATGTPEVKYSVLPVVLYQ